MIRPRQIRSKRRRRIRRRSAAGRALASLLRSGLWTAAILVFCVVAIVTRMSFGSLSTQSLAEPIARALTDQLSPGWSARISETGIALTDHGPALLAENIEIVQPDGTVFLRARAGEIAVDPWRFAYGEIGLTSVAFSGLDARLTMMPDGSLHPGDAANVLPPPAGTPQQQQPAVSFDEAVVGIANLLADQTGLTRSLDRVALSDARVTVIDVHGAERLTFADVTADLTREASGSLAVSLALQGPSGRWTARGDVTGGSGQERTVALALDGAPMTDLLMLAGAHGGLVEGDLTFSARLKVAITADNKLAALSGKLESSPGTVIYHDRDQPSFEVSAFRLEAEREEGSSGIRIPSLLLETNGSRFTLGGRVAFDDPDSSWRLQLDGRDAVLPPLSPREAPLAIDAVEVMAAGMRGGGLRIERVAVSGAGFGVALNGEIGGPGNEDGVRLGIQTARSNARSILRFWPPFVTPEPRRYLIDNLSAGIVDSLNVAVNLTAEQLAASRRREPLPADSVRTQFSASQVTLTAAPGFPPLEQATVSGLVTGATASVTASSAKAEVAPGAILDLSEGRMDVPRLTPPIEANIGFRLRGSTAALAHLLRREALKDMFNVDVSPESVGGDADLAVSITLPMVNHLRPEQVVTQAAGRIERLAIDLDGGKDRLTNASLQLNLDSKNLSLSGNGQLGGMPAELSLRQPLRKRDGSAQADITLTLDDAARAARGINLGKRLTGPVVARVSTSFSTGAAKPSAPAKVDVDLTRARIDNLLPGWTKAAGKPGRLTFSALDDNGYALSDIVLNAGSVSARGAARLNADGALKSASLTQVRLSPNDDFAVDADQGNGVLRLAVQGNLLDARSFLRIFREGASRQGGGQAGGGSGLNLDVNVAVNIIAGFNNETISKAALKLGLRGGEPERLRLTGSFSGAPLSAEMSGNTGISLATKNAGAALRFADIYAHMAGGDMQMHVDLAQGGAGKVLIRDFAIRNEPTMERILTESPKKIAVDPGNVPFTKLRVSFTRAPGRINIQEGVLWGPGVGVTIEGNVDTRNERIDVSGTYVPAYALNNIFSQVPLLGPLLGGGQYEGLFAINFRATGALDSPALTVNPLSAIAPGIFRKFFDLGRADSGQQQPAQPPPPGQ
ncbi:DUF3971 domain-containing protein [Pseudochelatococcus lubricantis]|uniref:YhdP family protein n=1 Tax=Pseudochelatococcus lubricantis TaxID=1538102 RepID=UPI0035E5090A